MIREKNPTISESSKYDSLCDETTYCNPLTGTFYYEDKQYVHQTILSFKTGHPLEDRIKLVARQNDRIISMTALRYHFSCEGNATRNIDEAEISRN